MPFRPEFSGRIAPRCTAELRNANRHFPLGYRGHDRGPLARSGSIRFREAQMHLRAGRMRMDLHEKLSDRLASQTLASQRKLGGGLADARFASQPDLETKLRIIVLRREIHGRYYGVYLNKYKGP